MVKFLDIAKDGSEKLVAIAAATKVAGQGVLVPLRGGGNIGEVRGS